MPSVVVSIGSSPVVVSVGRMVSKKGYGFLLEALPGLLGEHADAIRHYVETKPKGKFGKHRYQVESKVAERPLFKRYQALYGVPDEV